MSSELVAIEEFDATDMVLREVLRDVLGLAPERLAALTRESGLFLLADGMGGHPEGEVAAQLALQTISALYQKEARPVGQFRWSTHVELASLFTR